MTQAENLRKEIAYLEGVIMGLQMGAEDPEGAEGRANRRREEREELRKELSLLLESQDTWKF